MSKYCREQPISKLDEAGDNICYGTYMGKDVTIIGKLSNFDNIYVIQKHDTSEILLAEDFLLQNLRIVLFNEDDNE